MRFSVVIPTRARDATLARCLEGLRVQVEEESAEVIVTDDGDGESTRQMITSRFPFARWIRGPQRGPAANRNRGASLAVGDFILFLDDDVEPTPTLLAAYRRAVSASVNVYEGRTTCRAGLRSPLEDAPVNETGGALWSCNLLVRRTFWLAAGGFDEEFPYPHMEDVAFRERLKTTGERFIFVPDAAVDHPPRRVPPARVLARNHESDFVYSYKYLKEVPSLPKLLATVTRHRLGMVLSYQASRDTVKAVGSLFVEYWYLVRHWRAWDEKWSRRYPLPGARK